eukprot:TRINITY_DN12030_c0_g1_i1.p1 TRINITY_DN12030_c0_g1~~TRINITY_DN12030_c0_g1_i1.p1  ORF type:complete len:949 (-),score=7.64 TRINITY_DN12030_c0_g1_i1:74-2920(-)
MAYHRVSVAVDAAPARQPIVSDVSASSLSSYNVFAPRIASLATPHLPPGRAISHFVVRHPSGSITISSSSFPSDLSSRLFIDVLVVTKAVSDGSRNGNTDVRGGHDTIVGSGPRTQAVVHGSPPPRASPSAAARPTGTRQEPSGSGAGQRSAAHRGHSPVRGPSSGHGPSPGVAPAVPPRQGGAHPSGGAHHNGGAHPSGARHGGGSGGLGGLLSDLLSGRRRRAGGASDRTRMNALFGHGDSGRHAPRAAPSEHVRTSGAAAAAASDPAWAPGVPAAATGLPLLSAEPVVGPDGQTLEWPPDYCCPITGELFEDPVTTADGHTYDCKVIAEWFARRKAMGRPPSSPATGLDLPSSAVIPNLTVRKLVTAWREAASKSPRAAAAVVQGAAEASADHGVVDAESADGTCAAVAAAAGSQIASASNVGSGVGGSSAIGSAPSRGRAPRGGETSAPGSVATSVQAPPSNVGDDTDAPLCGARGPGAGLQASTSAPVSRVGTPALVSGTGDSGMAPLHAAPYRAPVAAVTAVRLPPRRHAGGQAESRGSRDSEAFESTVVLFNPARPSVAPSVPPGAVLVHRDPPPAERRDAVARPTSSAGARERVPSPSAHAAIGPSAAHPSSSAGLRWRPGGARSGDVPKDVPRAGMPAYPGHSGEDPCRPRGAPKPFGAEAAAPPAPEVGSQQRAQAPMWRRPGDAGLVSVGGQDPEPQASALGRSSGRSGMSPPFSPPPPSGAHVGMPGPLNRTRSIDHSNGPTGLSQPSPHHHQPKSSTGRARHEERSSPRVDYSAGAVPAVHAAEDMYYEGAPRRPVVEPPIPRAVPSRGRSVSRDRSAKVPSGFRRETSRAARGPLNPGPLRGSALAEEAYYGEGLPSDLPGRLHRSTGERGGADHREHGDKRAHGLSGATSVSSPPPRSDEDSDTVVNVASAARREEVTTRLRALGVDVARLGR